MQHGPILVVDDDPAIRAAVSEILAFEGYDVESAINGADGLLSVRPGVTGDELAFSSDPLQAGNSDNLLAIIGLQNQSVPITGLGTVRMGDVYTQLLGGIGIRSQQSQASFTTAKTVREQAEQSWASTSSVNTDEEAINLVQYQQMYTANMKVIQVAGELFDAVIGSLR